MSSLEVSLITNNEDTEREEWRRVCFLLCSNPDCEYLEFPGCSSHHVLFSRVEEDSKGHTLSVGCESCQYTTSNSSPFMDACRKCKKVKATPHAWVMSKKSVKGQAVGISFHSADEVDTCLMRCSKCNVAEFPVESDVLASCREGKIYEEKGKLFRDTKWFNPRHLYKDCKGTWEVVPVTLSKEESKYVSDHFAATASLPVEVFRNSKKPIFEVDEDFKASNTFARLLESEHLSDVTFVVGDEEAEFNAHRLVVAARSPVFRAMLFSGFAEAKQRKIRLPELEPGLFALMLKNMYTDDIEIDSDNVLQLLWASKTYYIEGLKQQCLTFLTEGLTKDNVCSLFEAAPHLLEEEQFALKYIEDNGTDVIPSNAFLNLSPESVMRIVSSNLLNAQEIDIFRAVLAWGVSEIKRRSEGKEDKEGKASELRKAAQEKEAAEARAAAEEKKKKKAADSGSDSDSDSGSSSSSSKGGKTSLAAQLKARRTAMGMKGKTSASSGGAFGAALETKESVSSKLKAESDVRELLEGVDPAQLRELVKDIVAQIRLPQIKMSDIGAVVAPSGLIDKGHLIFLYMYAAQPTKDRSIFPKDFPYSFEFREPRAIPLIYRSDFDQNGFFYMIATKQKTVPWQNPMDSGRVKVQNNGSVNGSIRSWMETNTPSDNTYFYNGRPNHITFNCGQNYLAPTHYTLRHNNSHTSNYFARNWRLEGSVDGVTWDTLSTHSNDQNLNTGHLIHTWEIKGITKMYCQFKIVQTGPGSNGTDEYMMCNGIEMYGRARFAKGDA